MSDTDLNTEAVLSWIEKSPYTSALGIALEDLDAEGVRLRLPFAEANSNPGKALHGGCAASLAVVGGQAVARAVLGEESGPWHTCSIQVNYLAAAIDEDVTARARLLRRGKELCFSEISIERQHDGKPIAHASAAVRGRFGAEPASLAKTRGDGGESDPGNMGPHIGKMPFMKGRGVLVEHMTGGTSRLVMPAGGGNADLAGGTHEGAVLALLDTTGAMASWAEVGPGPYKASTPSLQARFMSPPTAEDLVAYGTCTQRDRELLFGDVEVAGARTGSVIARGTVVYRIVT